MLQRKRLADVVVLQAAIREGGPMRVRIGCDFVLQRFFKAGQLDLCAAVDLSARTAREISTPTRDRVSYSYTSCTTVAAGAVRTAVTSSVFFF